MTDDQPKPGTPAWQQQLVSERRDATPIEIVSLDSALLDISFGAVFSIVLKVFLAIAILGVSSSLLVLLAVAMVQAAS